MFGKARTLSRLLKVAAVAMVPGLAGLIMARSYLREGRELFPERRAIAVSAVSAGLPGLNTVSFTDRRGVTLRGWYVSSANRAAIVLLHGAGGDRTSLLPEARHLASRGFGVLLFDWPGHGESDGEIHWSDGEARALVAAVDFLSVRPDLDVSRIGALGFSMGGAVLARVAPSELRLRAVILAGTPSDQVKQVKWENRSWGPLSQLPALLAVRRGGVPFGDNQPKDRVGDIAPRPVLVVSGAHDQTVPGFLADELFGAARQPKDLLVINGAGHGGYEKPSGSPYLERITAFFERALTGPES
jgi:pimeloyl-ACP methyl ester carboxylesterase